MKDPKIPGSTKASSRLSRLDAYWCAIAVICLCSFSLRLWLGLQFTWFVDDWTYIVRNNELSLVRVMFESYNGHLGPGQFLLVWLVGKIAPLSFSAATTVAAIVGAVSVGLWGLALRRVFGPRIVLLIPLAIVALSPIVLWANLWWASAVQAGPLQICMAAMVYRGARWVQDQRRGNLVLLIACLLVGLLFWEKAILCVIPTAAVMWMMLPGSWWERARAMFAPVCFTSIALVIYLVTYKVSLGMYPGTWYAISRQEPDFSLAGIWRSVEGAGIAARDVLAPGLVGGPWESIAFSITHELPHRTPLSDIAAIGVAALVLVGVALRRHGVVPLVMMTTYVVVALFLTVFSTTSVVIGRDAMKDPRLVADALAAVSLGISLLFLPTVTELETGTPFLRIRVGVDLRRTRRVLTAICAVGLTIGLTSGIRGLWSEVEDPPGRAWVENVREGLASRGPTLLVDARPPLEVYEFGYWPDEAWLSKMLAASSSARFTGSSDSLFTVKEDGHLQASVVKEMTAAEPGPVLDCGYALGAGEQTDLPLTNTLYAWNWAMEAAFIAGQPGELILTVDGVDIPLSVPKGVSTLYAPINSAISQVTISAKESSGTVCLVGMKFGSPMAKDNP